MLSVLAEIAVVVIAVPVGVSFWVVARTPAHLRSTLSDYNELARIIHFLDPGKLRDEARSIESVLGFAKNIDVWDYAHLMSLRIPRNLLVIVMIADLVAACVLSRWCLLAVLVVILLPVFFPLSGLAKNANVTHIHTIILNLIKWHEVDPTACELYCTEERPDLAVLHALVVTMPRTGDLRTFKKAPQGQEGTGV